MFSKKIGGTLQPHASCSSPAIIPAPSRSTSCSVHFCPLQRAPTPPSSPHSTRPPPPFLPRYRRGVRQRSMDRSTERRHRLLPNNNLAVRFVLSAVLTSRSTTSESSNMSIGGRRRSLSQDFRIFTFKFSSHSDPRS